MSNESVLMCNAPGGGCGYIGLSSTFGGDDGDFVPCPACNQDWTVQLTDANFASLVPTTRPDYASVKNMLENYYGRPDAMAPAKGLVSTICVKSLKTFALHRIHTFYLHRTPGKKRAVRVSISAGALGKAYLQPQDIIDRAAELAHRRGWKNIVVCVDDLYQESLVAYNIDLFLNQRYNKGHPGFYICDASAKG